MLATLAGGHADRSWDRRLAGLSRPAVLIDDFAMRELTAAQADDLDELVTARAAAGRSLLLTPPTGHGVDWYPLSPIPSGRIAARQADQHQPPSVHERPQLPAPPAPRHDTCLDGRDDKSVEVRGTVNIVTGPARPGLCPDHPLCLLQRCAQFWCPNHVNLRSPGQPRRFCSATCRVAEHRRLRA